MMMTKKVVFFGGMLAVALMMLPAHAALTDLPEGYLTGWGGKSSYALHLGGGQYLYGHIEFAVYDTQADGYSGFGAPGDNRFVYAYQIFTDKKANAALTYFGLLGINPLAITSAQDNMDTADVDGGNAPESNGMNLSKTEAYFEFADGVLIQNQKSIFLLLGSDYAPTIGEYQVMPSPDDEIPVPGDNDNGNSNPVPEPATLVLLLGGTLMALRKRKR